MKTNLEKGMALITALLVLLLISAIIVGFSWSVMTDQTMSGATNQRQAAFYAAEGGMEQLTANLNNLFAQNYAPTGTEITALQGVANEPNIPGTTFIDPAKGTAGSGYAINFQADKNGNPVSQNETITAGPYQGMQGLVTPYTLSVIAQGPNGGEVKLQRVVQTVGIPLFQFGIFSQTDLSFFAGPDFNFGGRVHTNGNLYLAEGGTLTLGDKVTAYGEVIRTNLSNGWPTATGYTGTVNVLTGPGNYRALQTTEGSLVGTLGSAENTHWSNISIGTYNGYIRDGDQDPPTYTGTNATGVSALNLEVATPLIGGTPIDLIRRPQQGEDNTTTGNPGKLGERYYSQASLRILLSDNPLDITGLPCETSSAPVDLSLLAQAGAQAQTGAWSSSSSGNATLQAIETQAHSEPGGAGSNLMPLAVSGAAGSTYSSTDGYWVPNGTPIIKGYIKIEAQTTYGVPCGTYQDVTAEILGLGYVGRNTDPYVSSGNPWTWVNPPTLPALPTKEISPSTCGYPNPNAIIRLERVRDNPSSGSSDPCGTSHISSLTTTDVWPNVLFDSREGNGRDWCPNGSGTCKISPTLGGLMYYVELDVNNLQKWFTGSIGNTGKSTKDPNTSSNDFTVYFSDRRGNYIATPLVSGWPPASPSTNETGEYGFNDVINPASQYGCPDNTLQGSEEFDSPQDTTLQTYGAQPGVAPYPLTAGGAYGLNNLYTLMDGSFGSLSNSSSSVLQPNWKCTTNPSYISVPVAGGPKVWPGWYVKNPQEARENPPLFFRRALKLINGSTINLGTCPNGNNCGLAIASENPVYIQGDFNAPGGSFTTPYGATSIIADAVTFLSDNWNDVNSITSTYDTGWRTATATAYRVAIAAGKGISFTQPTQYTCYQDFGTDGGVHNFLRQMESWSGIALNYKGSIVSLFYNRQAVGVYKDGSNNTVYSPANRGYNFDTDFLTPSLLPPRTPMFRDTNTIGFTQYLLPN
ncbi:MAG TPA: PilX N-terminal domain-containing pilus assembly protein [Candidatus Aquilonibacter sp.]|nr:PilX N-terminal domain-containing pilus assembly protein [Candidatus Aquilonibacter sp.]